MLSTEFTMVKQELEYLKELQREKVLRVQTETKRLEAMEMADTLSKKLDDMQRVLEGARSWTQIWDNDTGWTLSWDRGAVANAPNRKWPKEPENLKDLKMKEAFCKELDWQPQIKKDPAESSKLEDVGISEALFPSLEFT